MAWSTWPTRGVHSRSMMSLRFPSSPRAPSNRARVSAIRAWDSRASSKRVIGLRSTQLLERSQADAASLVDGYCFRFARPQDIRELAGHAAPAEVARVERDLSPYVLPIPIADVPDVVAGFRRDGFTTVIRLPLDSDEALQAAGEQVAALRDETVPIHLFLDRVSEIAIEEGTEAATRLSRVARPLMPGSGVLLEMVDLAGQGAYLVASEAVQRDRLHSAIRESVEHNRADESWLQ